MLIQWNLSKMSVTVPIINLTTTNKKSMFLRITLTNINFFVFDIFHRIPIYSEVAQNELQQNYIYGCSKEELQGNECYNTSFSVDDRQQQ